MSHKEQGSGPVDPRIQAGIVRDMQVRELSGEDRALVQAARQPVEDLQQQAAGIQLQLDQAQHALDALRLELAARYSMDVAHISYCGKYLIGASWT